MTHTPPFLLRASPPEEEAKQQEPTPSRLSSPPLASPRTAAGAVEEEGEEIPFGSFGTEESTSKV